MKASVMLSAPVPRKALGDKPAEGISVPVGVSCATCPHNVEGHMGQRKCDLSGAQVWPHEPKPPATPGVNEGIGNKRDEQRPVRQHGLDMDRLRCPLCLPLGNSRAMSPLQIIGVLVVAAERGKLPALLSHYGDEERAYLRDLLADWLENQQARVRLRFEAQMQARERRQVAAGQRSHATKAGAR